MIAIFTLKTGQVFIECEIMQFKPHSHGHVLLSKLRQGPAREAGAMKNQIQSSAVSVMMKKE